MKTSRRDFLKLVTAGSVLALVPKTEAARSDSLIQRYGRRQVASVRLPISRRSKVILLAARQLSDGTWVADVMALK